MQPASQMLGHPNPLELKDDSICAGRSMLFVDGSRTILRPKSSSDFCYPSSYFGSFSFACTSSYDITGHIIRCEWMFTSVRSCLFYEDLTNFQNFFSFFDNQISSPSCD